MEENKQELRVIDINDIIKKLWAGKILYFKVLPVVFVLACIFILGFPRTYSTSIRLAPEMGGSSMGGTLGSLASSFGIDLESMQTSDAITPLLYPDLIDDNGFIGGIFKIHVTSKDGSIDTDYYDYLVKNQKSIIWLKPYNWVKNQIKKLKNRGQDSGNGEFNPYSMTRLEDEIAIRARSNIKIDFDKKTAVINIEFADADGMVCKTMGESAMKHLQRFITDYRTSKARNDYEYYSALTDQDRKENEAAVAEYSKMADANSRVALKSVQMKLEAYENDIDLKLNAYTTVNAQMVAAKAKIQERTPAFTVIKGASVPVKPSKPKRMVFVALMLILGFCFTSLYILSEK